MRKLDLDTSNQSERKSKYKDVRSRGLQYNILIVLGGDSTDMLRTSYNMYVPDDFPTRLQYRDSGGSTGSACMRESTPYAAYVESCIQAVALLSNCIAQSIPIDNQCEVAVRIVILISLLAVLRDLDGVLH